MWPDFRIIDGYVTDGNSRTNSAGLRILLGKELKAPQFEYVKQEVNSEGYPIHCAAYDFGDCELRMESFCTIGRVPDTYIRFSVRNKTIWEVQNQVALMLRTGREVLLTGMEIDGYGHLDNNVGSWGVVENKWKYNTDVLTDGNSHLQLQHTTGFTLSWIGDVAGEVFHHKN
jgi:hypothetical protein